MENLIREAIENAESNGLSWFGIRHHHEIVIIGDELGNSYNTIDAQEPEELDGICCIDFNSEDDSVDFVINFLKDRGYQDGPMILVGGTSQTYGNDEFEVIIEDAEVLFIL
jgi:hypothetical protein